ncbi:hypothetical protein [Streptococcus sciuri]|uniref:Uncharacterized protein n=1 Tax=Streptococcus sciuri TaxID=2973939 RepID=A0ABT2F6G4_9STRE|nr:hypothetical protein [Streptococcus sciuri]MCS4487616.1 hypothetical protein [Streptococcus sciuri]
MKKQTKLISIFLTTLIVGTTTLPNISTVYALENISQSYTTESSSTLITPPSSLSESQIDSLADELQALHPDVSKEWIEEVINRQLQGDYSLPINYSPFRAAWQGITVGQMGVALDTAISLALGGTTAGLASLIKVKGKHAVKSAIRSAIAKYLGSWFVNDVILEIAMNALSPRAYLAKLWDKNDAIPNNGRINF